MRFLVCLLIVLGSLAIYPNQAMADRGYPDTLYLIPSQLDQLGDDSVFTIEAWCFNDADEIVPQFGFEWESDHLTLDSARASAIAIQRWNFLIFYDLGDPAVSNANNRAMFGLLATEMNTLPPSMNRQHIATYYYTLSGWSPNDEILIDTAKWDDGTEMVFFSPYESYIPVWYYGDEKIVVTDPTDVQSNLELPESFSLGQNYPNRFNPSTNIEFTLSQGAHTQLSIYNVLGQEVRTLVGRPLPTGKHSIEWDSRDDSGNELASGVYFYRLASGDHAESKKMLLVK